MPIHRVDAGCFQISGNCDFLVAVESHAGNHQSHSNVILQDPEYLLDVRAAKDHRCPPLGGDIYIHIYIYLFFF